MRAKTPHGRYAFAKAALDKWITRAIRAAKEIEKIRKTIRRYEQHPIPRVEKRLGTTHAQQPKQNLWTPGGEA